MLRVIRSNQLFAAAEVSAFENEFKEFVGASHAIGVGNATQGLQLALAALGVGTGDEAGLIQGLSQCLLPGLRAWVEVGGIAPFPCLKARLPQPIST